MEILIAAGSPRKIPSFANQDEDVVMELARLPSPDVRRTLPISLPLHPSILSASW